MLKTHRLIILLHLTVTHTLEIIDIDRTSVAKMPYRRANYCPSAPNSTFISCWWLEISPGGSIHSKEMRRHYK